MVDYSKWKNIEISDDEDETHPNIDTPSLFRWRHQARVERMEQMESEKKQFDAKKRTNQFKIKDVQEKLKKNDGDADDLKKQLEAFKAEENQIKKEEDELKKKENKTPWNVDTISKPGFQKTVINKKPEAKSDDNLTEEEREARMKEFIKKNESAMKQYGMLKKYDDTKKFLLEHNNLVSEDTANYLVIWCINLEMEEKHELMHHIAHQCICMQYILELAKQLDVDPRACVSSFFDKIQNCVVEYRNQFDNEISEFIKRIENRSKAKIEEAMQKAEEEERENRLGPGGLDPAEVFESLPETLQKCFESRDIKLLQDTIAAMPEIEAKYHMKRCVDSGLWVPDSNKSSTEEESLKETAEESQSEIESTTSAEVD